MLSHALTLGSETVDLGQAYNRILTEPVCSDLDMPPYPKSIRDGYACRQADLPGPLRVVETIPAGTPPRGTIGRGQCAKIMTGAMVPPGADCVIMVEETGPVGEDRILCHHSQPGNYIAARGEDIRAGSKVADQGERLTAAHLAVLAAVGCVSPRVAVQPKVGLLETGDELIPPAEKPGPTRIRAGVRHALEAQLQQVNALPTYYGIARDDPHALRTLVAQAMQEQDVLLICGGVSMGDLDFVPQVLQELGFKIVFARVAVQPGKPMTLAVSGTKVILGLPGNPVSSMVQFELLVKPFLYAMQGFAFRPPVTLFPMASAWRRKDTQRQFWVPVRLTPASEIEVLPYHGSAHVLALAQADGLMKVPIGVDRLEPGMLVEVRLLRHD